MSTSSCIFFFIFYTNVAIGTLLFKLRSTVFYTPSTPLVSPSAAKLFSQHQSSERLQVVSEHKWHGFSVPECPAVAIDKTVHFY